MHIALVTKPGHTDSGVGRYAQELAEALRRDGHTVTCVAPAVPLPRAVVDMLRRLLGWDLVEFFYNYPVWAVYPKADIYHIASQNLATLMLFRRPPGPTLITVHDLFPHMMRHDPILSGLRHPVDRIMNRLAMWGLSRAHGLVTVSTYARDCLGEQLTFEPAIVAVTLEGVLAAEMRADMVEELQEAVGL